MFLKAFPSGPFQTNSYLIGCQGTNKAAIIDPAPGAYELLTSFLKNTSWQMDAIWLTHSHWDHIADVSKVKAHWKVPIWIHSLDEPNLKKPGSDQLPCWIAIEGQPADHFFSDGDVLTLGNLSFLVIHTPGHTPGGVCFWCEKEAILLSGDTLFKQSIGNLSFPTANADSMWKSLDRLASLPKETKVFPGHGPSTTIGQEPWLKEAKTLFGN